MLKRFLNGLTTTVGTATAKCCSTRSRTSRTQSTIPLNSVGVAFGKQNQPPWCASLRGRLVRRDSVHAAFLVSAGGNAGLALVVRSARRVFVVADDAKSNCAVSIRPDRGRIALQEVTWAAGRVIRIGRLANRRTGAEVVVLVARGTAAGALRLAAAAAVLLATATSAAAGTAALVALVAGAVVVRATGAAAVVATIATGVSTSTEQPSVAAVLADRAALHQASTATSAAAGIATATGWLATTFATAVAVATSCVAATAATGIRILTSAATFVATPRGASASTTAAAHQAAATGPSASRSASHTRDR